MADISSITLPNNGGTYNFKDQAGRYEANLSWGGRSVSGGITPADAGCIDEFGHNKIAFIPPGCLTVQYSTDGGSTWVDYGLSDTEKTAITTLEGYNVGIGKYAARVDAGTLTDDNCTNYLSRIIIGSRDETGEPKVYTSLTKILINVSTSGATGSHVLVERRNIGDYNNKIDNWIRIGDYPLSGWSGWNSIPYGTTFGGSKTQTGNPTAEIRFTFGITGVDHSANKYSSVLSFSDFRFIGITNWTMPSELARVGRLYDITAQQHAVFPGAVVGNNIKSRGSATQPVYFDSNGWAQSTTYKLEKSVPSDAKFTDTQANWNETSTSSAAYIQNKPTIPTESTVSGWGFTKNTGTYSKPSGGIPESDLNADVQLSLDHAEKAYEDVGKKLDKTGGTVTGTLILSKTTDASSTADNRPALIIGGTPTAEHIEIDGNEILAKDSDTTAGTLALNYDGGAVTINGTNAVRLASLNTAVGSASKPVYVDADGVVKAANNIPTESTVSGWGFTKNTGTYSKPSDGIPKTDLAETVALSIDKGVTGANYALSLLTSIPTASGPSSAVNVVGKSSAVDYKNVHSVTISQKGTYLALANAAFNANATGGRHINVQKNGSNVGYAGQSSCAASPISTTVLHTACVINCAVNDVITIQAAVSGINNTLGVSPRLTLILLKET